ncbi:MAG: hypothetical protein WCK95_27705 [Alphaproteobacteria bacterium]
MAQPKTIHRMARAIRTEGTIIGDGLSSLFVAADLLAAADSAIII